MTSFFSAFVIHQNDKGSYFAWCESLGYDIMIPERLSPRGIDLLAKWVEVGLDSRDNATQVSLKSSQYESRKCGKFAEVKVDFRHRPSNDEYNVFENECFGTIYDTKRIIARVVEGATYQAWIVNVQVRGEAKWTISSANEPITPIIMNNEQLPGNGTTTSEAKSSSFGRHPSDGFGSDHRRRSPSFGRDQRFEYRGNYSENRGGYDQEQYRRRSRSPDNLYQYRDGYNDDRRIVHDDRFSNVSRMGSRSTREHQYQGGNHNSREQPYQNDLRDGYTSDKSYRRGNEDDRYARSQASSENRNELIRRRSRSPDRESHRREYDQRSEDRHLASSARNSRFQNGFDSERKSQVRMEDERFSRNGSPVRSRHPIDNQSDRGSHTRSLTPERLTRLNINQADSHNAFRRNDSREEGSSHHHRSSSQRESPIPAPSKISSKEDNSPSSGVFSAWRAEATDSEDSIDSYEKKKKIVNRNGQQKSATTIEKTDTSHQAPTMNADTVKAIKTREERENEILILKSKLTQIKNLFGFFMKNKELTVSMMMAGIDEYEDLQEIFETIETLHSQQ